MKSYEEMIKELEDQYAWYRYFVCKIKAGNWEDANRMESLCRDKNEAFTIYKELKQFASFIYEVPTSKISSDVKALCKELGDYIYEED